MNGQYLKGRELRMEVWGNALRPGHVPHTGSVAVFAQHIEVSTVGG